MNCFFEKKKIKPSFTHSIDIIFLFLNPAYITLSEQKIKRTIFGKKHKQTNNLVLPFY